ncbi:DUF6473 family protein [Nioella nitratireducens]|uniref:DUF6473 family protein n=1 Tax=Nioella nitratireducens TaxID=1287720 RepID=UPI0008FD812B|nr:DUF6473 family protein [Nioella nitratireducens]
MSYAQTGHGPLDYQPCQYDGSPMTFRGPKAGLDQSFVLCLGGSETFGKFTPEPYPDQLAKVLGRRVVNMGAMNAGVDLLLYDAAITGAAARAEAVVLQLPGAANLSNRFFTVHPRRNDRFVKASTMLRTIYREVDFTEFHFTRHMLTALRRRSEDRFSIILQELREAWQARMIRVLSQIEVPVHLLWLSQRAPDDDPLGGDDLGDDPLFVDGEMLDTVARHAASTSVCVTPTDARAPAQRGMYFGRGEDEAARLMPGPADHARVAGQLAAVLT